MSGQTHTLPHSSALPRSQVQIPRLVPRPIKVGRQAEGSTSRVGEWLVKSAVLSCEGAGGEVHSSVAQVIENEPLPGHM